MEVELKRFTAELRQVPGMNAAYFNLPFNPVEVYGKRHMIKVRATIDGVPYRGSLVDMGFGTCLGVTQEIRKIIGKNPGDLVEVTLEPDLEERTIEIPEDLASVLYENTAAAQWFHSLSYTNRKEFVNWITGAKKQETREIRLAKTIELLLSKKKNPSDK